ncbi:D-alanyl-D-alanine carboxypeptidase [Vallitalea pronyensis]|uniref:serine-type D-Ala-D-Ala carboxypeptidase n=1 Tax=Vallitalea pronyensis TaxID=1348613 RepID=A0A8J8MJZ8_9FIRM|nr:D-alanyl-D-alanine carboxypeptidase family protein [Vallitalea pronyensis]QUI23079.1 D-alanyl-D-alanine carboxypeptidase [Vallitalea pronyensis]
MKKRLFCYVLSLTLLLSNGLYATVYAGEDAKTAPTANLELKAKSALLMEPTTGKIIYELNAHEKLRPASITKIMTLLLLYEAVESGKIKWDEDVLVSEHASGFGGSTVFLETGEIQPVKELAKSIAVASGNDAAVAMAEHIAGSEEAFVQMMNNKAKELGMENTNFVNACGLDADGHVTSAYDVALMSRELINKYPQVYDFTKIWMDTLVHQRKNGEEVSELVNTNKLLKWYPEYATGLKTGSTSLAKFCLSGTARKNDLDLIAVIMAAPDPKARFQETIKLLEYGFANTKLYKDPIKGKSLGNIPVNRGTSDQLDGIAMEDFSCILDNNSGMEVTHDVELLESIDAPVKAGDKLGEVIYKAGDEVVGRIDLVADKDVPKATFRYYIGKLLKMFFQ